MDPEEIPQDGQTTAAGLDHRSVLERAALLGVLTVAARLLAFAAIVAATRHFGASGLGAIGLAQQLAMIAVVMGTFGVDVLAIRTVVQSPARSGDIASSIIALRLALGVPVFAGLIVSSFAVPQFREIQPLLVLFGLSIFSGAVTLLWLPQALHRSHVLGLANVASQAIYLLGVWIGIALGEGIWIVPAAFVSGEIASAIGLAAWSKRAVGRFGKVMRPAQLLAFLRSAAPIGGGQLFRAIALGSDLAIAGLFLSLEEVGWYTGAFKLYLLGISAVGIYFVVLFPHLAEIAGGPLALLRRELRVSNYRLLILAVPAVAVGIGLAEWMLQFLYGPSFATAAGPLRILLLALLALTISGHARQALLALGEQRVDLFNVGIASALHITLKLILIPALGMQGAALGTLAGELLLIALSGFGFMRIYRNRIAS